MIVDEKVLSRWIQVILVTLTICVTMQALFPHNEIAQRSLGVVVNHPMLESRGLPSSPEGDRASAPIDGGALSRN